LQAGRMAGSSSNSQPIRFIVMRDRAVVEALVSASRGGAPALKSPLPIAIMLKKGARDFDVGRAAQNMMVAAWADGVISCPFGIQDKELAQKVLGHPDDFEVSIGVAFGYPEEGSPKGRGQMRLALEELVHWDRW
jgi:nitroreductase